MKKTVVKNKVLSRKRFIPLVLISILGIVGIIAGKEFSVNLVHKIIAILNTTERTAIISFVGIVIGVLHYIHIGRKNSKINSDLFRYFSSLFTSIATSIGYTIMLNSALSFSINILNEWFFDIQFFTANKNIDYLPLLLIALSIVSVACLLLWQQIEEFVFDVKEKPVTPTPLKKGHYEKNEEE